MVHFSENFCTFLAHRSNAQDKALIGDNAPYFGVDDAALIDGIRKVGKRTPIVASVCTGAALIARAGLLDGMKATTNKTAWNWVTGSGYGKGVHWVSPPRWVDCIDPVSLQGCITSGGVSAGTDMALGLINKLDGRQVVDNTMVLMEYSWNEDPEQDDFRYICPCSNDKSL